LRHLGPSWQCKTTIFLGFCISVTSFNKNLITLLRSLKLVAFDINQLVRTTTMGNNCSLWVTDCNEVTLFSKVSHFLVHVAVFFKKIILDAIRISWISKISQKCLKNCQTHYTVKHRYCWCWLLSGNTSIKARVCFCLELAHSHSQQFRNYLLCSLQPLNNFSLWKSQW
jgi:hypothetical protein